MLVFCCPTFTLPNHHGLLSKHESLQRFKMSPLLLLEAKALQQKNKDGSAWQMELRKIRKLLSTIEKESFCEGLANEILLA